MVNDLELKGRELQIFALIHGFTEKIGSYDGTLKYLADWTGSSRRQVHAWLKDLCGKGYISKKSKVDKGVRSVSYRSEKLNGVFGKSERGVQNNSRGVFGKSETDNTENKKTNNNSIYKARERVKITDPGAGSFDAEEFFNAALNRTYREIKEKINE